ncbi:hypothetical protein ACT29H_16605 [Thermophagus sp. OGC60D27]|uniref:hypothetical protein n=1 Tax=Thermophagus sp. OGC60D27 TaxID=3458415 RepID=UPI004037B411
MEIELVFIGYIGNLAFWGISLIESNDFYLDEEKVVVRNRLKPYPFKPLIYYSNIEYIQIVNLRKTRHSYQRVEVQLIEGKLLKYACTGIKAEELMAMKNEFEKYDLKVINVID